jgi:hypothetical protein
VNVGGTYPTGCSCEDDGSPKTCSSAANIATLTIGHAAIDETGVLPTAGESNWYSFTFATDTGTTAYHPKIALTGADVTGLGTGVVFAVYTSCAGSVGGPLATTCSFSGGDNTGEGALTTWEIQDTDPNTPIDTHVPITDISATGEVWIEVYRATGSPTCNTYTLAVSD